MAVGIYAGSFDPFTYGHIDVIQQARRMFDVVHVVVANNPDKKCLLPVGERISLLRSYFQAEDEKFQIRSWDGLTVDYPGQWETLPGQKVLIRGIRNVTDMIGELALSDINEELSAVRTVFIPCSNPYRNYSSTLVKELHKHGKRVDKYVTHSVVMALQEKKDQ